MRAANKFILIFFLLSTINTMAQDKLRGGITGGFNMFGKVSNPEFTTSKSNSSFGGGIFVDYYVSKKTHLSFLFNYSIAKYSFRFNQLSGSYYGNMYTTYDYVNASNSYNNYSTVLMGNYDVYKKEKMSYFVGLGPGFTIFSQKNAFEFDHPYFTQSNDFTRLSRASYCTTGNFETGARFNVSNKVGVIVYGKYEYGFQKIKLGWFLVNHTVFSLNTGMFF